MGRAASPRTCPPAGVLIVVCTVAFTSAIGGQGPAPAAQVNEAPAWPSVFSRVRPAQRAEPWKEARARTGRLEIRLPHPPAWTVGSYGEQLLMIAHAADWSRSFSVMPPMPAPFQIEQMSRDRLLAFAGAMAGTNTSRVNRTLLAAGQTRTPDGTLWIWLELDVPPGAVAPGLGPLERMAVESARIWTFVATKSGHMVTVHCDALSMRGTSASVRQAVLANAGADCAHMLERFSANDLP